MSIQYGTEMSEMTAVLLLLLARNRIETKQFTKRVIGMSNIFEIK